KLVFESDTVAQKIIYHQMREPTPVREYRPDVPEGLDAVLRRMMRKEPADRFQTPGEVATALAAWVKPTPEIPNPSLMPKVAAAAYRLGLCPAPNPAEIAGPPSDPVRTPAPPPETLALVGPDTPRSEPGRSASQFPESSAAPRSRKTAWILGAALAAVAAVAGLVIGLWPKPEQPPGSVPRPQNEGTAGDNTPKPPAPAKGGIVAGGSTFLAPAMRQWSTLYGKQTGINIEY